MDKTFWRATLIRAIRTICQTAVATIGTAMAVTEVNWIYVMSASALAGILSVLTSVATGLPEVDAGELLGSGMQTIYHTYPDESEPEEEREV